MLTQRGSMTVLAATGSLVVAAALALITPAAWAKSKAVIITSANQEQQRQGSTQEQKEKLSSRERLAKDLELIQLHLDLIRNSPKALRRHEENRAEGQAHLSRLATIDRERAIEIARNEHPGRLLDCKLVGYADAVYYSIKILTSDPEQHRMKLLVNARSGDIVFAVTEIR